MNKKNIFVLLTTSALIVAGWYLGKPAMEPESASRDESRLVFEDINLPKPTDSNLIQQTVEDAGSKKKKAWLAAPITRAESIVLQAAGRAGGADSAISAAAKKEDPEYRALFQSMGLSPGEVEKMMLLIEKRRRQDFDSMTAVYRTPNLTNGMIADAINKQKDLKKQATEEMLSQLGNESNRSVFEQWESTRTARRRIADFEVTIGRQFKPNEVGQIVEILNANSKKFVELLKNNDDQNLRSTIINGMKAKLGRTMSEAEIDTLVRMHTTPKVK